MKTNTIIQGNCVDVVKAMPDKSIHCVVTSPPYFGLRDYGDDNQFGLEETPEAFVENLVTLFKELKRVLKDDGTVWLVIGDSYWSNTLSRKDKVEAMWGNRPASDLTKGRDNIPRHNLRGGITQPDGIKPKDLMGIPWMVAFALRADGWWLRQDIIWHKPNPMPESVTDRCTKSHEYIFLLTKSQRYFYDAEAIKEKAARPNDVQIFGGKKALNNHIPEGDPRYRGGSEQWGREHTQEESRNKRSVWTVATKPYKEAHFAVYPEELIVPCIKAGCPEGGTVLDPFFGSGTTGVVAHKLNRKFIGIELNTEYIKIAENRLKPYLQQTKLF